MPLLIPFGPPPPSIDKLLELQLDDELLARVEDDDDEDELDEEEDVLMDSSCLRLTRASASAL